MNLPASSAASARALSHVRWEIRGPAGRIRMADLLTRNRLSPELLDGLVEAISALAAVSEIRVILLEGLSDVFSAGASEQALLGDWRASLAACRDAMRAIANCPVPVVVAAQGHATGGGLLLALIADFTVLSQRSRRPICGPGPGRSDRASASPDPRTIEAPARRAALGGRQPRRSRRVPGSCRHPRQRGRARPCSCATSRFKE